MAGQGMNWESCLQHAALTDVGQRRANNQDSHGVVIAADMDDWQTRGHMFVVADGMGAHAAGELASKLAVDNITHLYYKHRELSPPEALYKAFTETNAEIHRRGEANLDFHNMGTTTSVLLLLPQGSLIAHVGDSRIYRLRGQRLEQLTFDHSLVWEMRAAGDAEGSTHVPKNVITRSLGPKSSVQVDVEGPLALEVGDTFLLCSDGLSGPVKDEEMAVILASLPPKEAARLLIDFANLRGGPDNITVEVIRVTGPELTTRVAGGEPLTVGDEPQSLPVPLAVWIVAGVCLLVGAIFFVSGSHIAGMLAALGGVVALTVGLLRTSTETGKSVSLGGGKRLGKGPYTRTETKLDAAFVDMVANWLGQLRSRATAEDWPIDWNSVREHASKAEAARVTNKSVAALREFAAGLAVLTPELRKRVRPKSSDSNVNL